MSEKVNYQVLSENILENIGGKKNIKHTAHCATRLRLNLVDDNQINEEGIKSLTGVLGVAKIGGQLQVIIGPEVSKLYDVFTNIVGENTNLDEVSVNKDDNKFSIKKIGNGILDGLSGSLTPAIPVLTVAAFFKMFAAILGPDMLKLITAESDLYVLLSFVGDTTFYFFPVILGFTAAKKFKVIPILGILLGAILINPTYVGIAESGESFKIFGIPSAVYNYSATIIPIVMSVWIMSYVEKATNKYTPAILRSFLAPALTIAIMLPITFVLVGPLGAILGTAVANGILSIGTNFGFLGIALIGALFPFLIFTGMHMILIMAAIQAFIENGSDSLVGPGMTVASFAIMGMALGAALKLKNRDDKTLAWSYFATVVLSGTSEPALYGIGMRFKKPLLTMALGGFIGGLYYGILNTGAYTMIPLSSVLCILNFAGNTTINLINGIVGAAIALVVAAIGTYFWGFPNENKTSKE